MLNRCLRLTSTGRRPSLRLAAAALLLAAASPGAATAATAPDPLLPLGIVGDASRPSCTSPYGPLDPGDVVGTDPAGYDDELPTAGPAGTEVAAAAYGFEFLPAVRICSPTFGGIPGAIGGTIASAPRRTRVGVGWRELGGTFVQPAALTPGDVLTLPEVDDAAQVRLSVARSADRPTATISLSDLAPGPSTLTIGEDARGLVATLVRGDGTTSEGVVAPAEIPTLDAKVSGTRKRWTLDLGVLPGTFAYVSSYLDDYDRNALATATSTPAGRVRLTLHPRTRNGRRTSITLVGGLVNRDAHTLSTIYCGLRSTRTGRPSTARCSPASTTDLFDGDDVTDPFDDWGSMSAAVQRASRSAVQFAATAAKATTHARLPVPAPSRAATGQVAHRNAVMGRSASRAAAAPLVAREVPRSPAERAAGFDALRPLAADINGDGATDFWTDLAPETPSWTPSLRTTAGYVMVSTPAGLAARRVDVPSSSPYDSFDSEISAIADVTGDGIGELVVDLRERHALIPGSRSWSTSEAPISTPDLSELEPTDVVLEPGVSSPGSPYAAIDDASGDGLRDLVGTDDLGGWYTVASSQIRAGRVTRLPTIARAVPVPVAVKASLGFESAAPRVDPRVRVIAGQAVTLRWPVVASAKAPEGSVEITVRTGSGTAVRPPITVKTPGNAVLLDYDRPSGDLLLLAVGANCVKGASYRRGRCRESFLRVRADGAIRQTLTVDPGDSISYVGAARFVTDGPDADGDVDVVYTVGSQAIGVAESTAGAVLREAALPVTRIADDVPFYDDLRLIPVVEPSGARKLTVALPAPAKTSGYAWSGRNSSPAEIVWK